jgi:hypothetical protein
MMASDRFLVKFWHLEEQKQLYTLDRKVRCMAPQQPWITRLVPARQGQNEHASLWHLSSHVCCLLDKKTVMYIALSFGLGLLVTAWVFYRVTGALFNPAITFALWLIGGLTAFRASLLVVAQILGGISASALVAALTPFGGVSSLRNTLGVGTNVVQGLFIEVSRGRNDLVHRFPHRSQLPPAALIFAPSGFSHVHSGPDCPPLSS